MDVLLMILTVHLEFSTRALCLFVCEFIVLKTFFFWTLNITLTFDDIHVPQWVGTKDKRSHSVNIICWTLYSTQKNHSEKHFWFVECPKNVDLINSFLPTYFNTRNSFASYHLQMRDILRKNNWQDHQILVTMAWMFYCAWLLSFFSKGNVILNIFFYSRSQLLTVFNGS